MGDYVSARASGREILPAIVDRSTYVTYLFGCADYPAATGPTTTGLGYGACIDFGYSDRQPLGSTSLAAHDDIVWLSPCRHERA